MIKFYKNFNYLIEIFFILEQIYLVIVRLYDTVVIAMSKQNGQRSRKHNHYELTAIVISTPFLGLEKEKSKRRGRDVEEN